jgi:hypothetical protein
MTFAIPTASHQSAWRSAFADALIKLQPDMNPDAADELSDAAFMDLSNLPPNEAAARWASDRAVSSAVQATDFVKRGKSGDSVTRPASP